MAGRVVLEDRFRLEAGNHKIRLILPALAAGAYSLEVSDGTGAKRVRKLSAL